jgi:predicted glutamine amidotransferase
MAQRHRGTQGFGYYLPETNRLAHNPDEKRLLTDLKRQRGASEVLFHHRFPTSTANVQNACHPFSTRGDMFKHNYVLVHNGYLSNEDTLKDAHEALGIKYVSEQPDGRFNDSEALLYDVALYLEGKQDKLNAKGAIAFVVIERDEAGEAIKLHWGRNGSSPLKIDIKDESITIASEGQGKDVPTNRLFTHEYGSGMYDSIELDIPAYVYTQTGYTQAGYTRSYGDDYPSMTKTIEKYEPIEYDYHDSDGTHYVGSTDPKVGESECHKAGEPCDYVYGQLVAPSAKRVSEAADYMEVLLANNGDWTEAAIEEAYADLAEREAELYSFKELVNSYNTNEQVNDFLEASEHVNNLEDDIKMMNRVIDLLEVQLAYEEQSYDLSVI